MMTIEVRYYTDPVCTWSWGAVVEAELWGLARDWRLKPVPALTGTLWELA